MSHSGFLIALCVFLDTITIPISRFAGSCQLVEDWFPAEATRPAQRSSRRSDPSALPSAPFPASTFTKSATLQPTSSSSGGARASSASASQHQHPHQSHFGSGLFSSFSFSWGKQRERQTSSTSAEHAVSIGSSSTLPSTASATASAPASSAYTSSASSTSTLITNSAASGSFFVPGGVTVRVKGLYRELSVLPVAHYKPLIEVRVIRYTHTVQCPRDFHALVQFRLSRADISKTIG